jgi:transcriptional regulator with XRE-family HTH domain
MDRIRQLRKERGLSQAKLAVMADMDPATLNRLERGTGNPNLKTLERVADTLGVKVEDFFREQVRPLAEEPSEPKVVTGSMHAKVDARTFEILVTALTGEVYEVIDGLADGELSREEAKERVSRVLEPILQ